MKYTSKFLFCFIGIDAFLFLCAGTPADGFREIHRSNSELNVEKN